MALERAQIFKISRGRIQVTCSEETIITLEVTFFTAGISWYVKVELKESVIFI